MILHLYVLYWTLPGTTKVRLERPPRHIQPKQTEHPPHNERQERGEEQFRPRHERQRRVSQIRDVDILSQRQQKQGVTEEETSPIPPHDERSEGKKAEVEREEEGPEGVHCHVERVPELDAFPLPCGGGGEEEAVGGLVEDKRRQKRQTDEVACRSLAGCLS